MQLMTIGSLVKWKHAVENSNWCNGARKSNDSVWSVKFKWLLPTQSISGFRLRESFAPWPHALPWTHRRLCRTPNPH